MPRQTFKIGTSTHGTFRVEPNAGVLADYDHETDDPADFAARIWECIDERGPIWTDQGVVYLNAAHVVLVRESD